MSTAIVLAPLAVLLLAAGCQRMTKPPARPAVVMADAVTPSPRLIVGRVIATDLERAFAFVELTSDAPAGATSSDAELTSRTADLQTTAQLRASPYRRGRIVGTTIVAGKPAFGDEVVWHTP